MPFKYDLINPIYQQKWEQEPWDTNRSWWHRVGSYTNRQPPTKGWLPWFKRELLCGRWKLLFIWSPSTDLLYFWRHLNLFLSYYPGLKWRFRKSTLAVEGGLHNYKQTNVSRRCSAHRLSVGTKKESGAVPTSSATVSSSLSLSYQQVMLSSRGTSRESGTRK